MIGRLSLAALGLLVCQGALALTVESGDAGFGYQFQTLRSSFTVINDTDKEVVGLSIKPVRPADRIITRVADRLAPGQRIAVEVELHTEDDFGARGHSFLVEEAGSKTPLVARVRFYALSVLREPQRSLDFGIVNAGETPQVEYRVDSEDPLVRIAAVKEVPPFVDAHIADDGRKLIVKHAATSGWGRLDGTVKVQLKSREQTEAWIPVVSEVQGAVKPSTTSLFLGIARIGQENEFILQYRHGEGKPFRIDNAVVEGVETRKTQVEDCTGGEKGCQQVRFVIDDAKQPKGQLRGLLRAHIAGADREIRVLIGGLLVTKETKIETLESLIAQSKNAPSSEADLGLALSALKTAEQNVPVEPAAPAGDGPLLRWSVNNDDGVYAYAIYRAESAEGPFSMLPSFVRRNMYPIKGAPSAYVARDTGAVSGKDYWYRIVMLHSDGRREFLTTAQRVKAGAPTPAAQGEAANAGGGTSGG